MGVEIRTGAFVKGACVADPGIVPSAGSNSQAAQKQDKACSLARFRVSYDFCLEKNQCPKSMDVHAESLIVASGGLSFARSCGATDLAHKLAENFGLQVRGVKPGLVPLTVAKEDSWICKLSGVSMPVRASVGQRSF